MRILGRRALFGSALWVAAAGLVSGQTPAPAAEPPVPQQVPTPDQDEPVRPHGQIIIQSHGEAPAAGDTSRPTATGVERAAGPDAKVDVSDAERSSLTFTRYDLDARLDLQHSGLSMRALVLVRNDGAAPLKQLPLQVSSSLHWDSATLVGGNGQRTRLALAQHRLDTDADHTGSADEAVLPLPEPLAPGATAQLDLFYSGTIEQSGGRLARLGASASQQKAADWDAIGPAWTGLRGFGNVLWYPVATPQLFLAEGNTLFTAISRTRLHGEAATVRLRLSVDYTGEPPAAAYFCGRRSVLKAITDDPGAAIASESGVATAEFGAEPLGFRLPSLFVIREPEVLVGGPETAKVTGQAPNTYSTSVPTDVPGLRARKSFPLDPAESAIVALDSTDLGAAAGLGPAADRAASLLVEWLGTRPLSALTVLDHEGQPFQDGPLLVAPAATLETSPEEPALVYSLTHAWVQTGQPWMDEGLSQFFALLSIERERGRDVALAQMRDLMQPVALAEPDLTAATAEAGPGQTVGQPLVSAPDELFYRRKAAAVWWMLRDIAGEKPLRAALSAWRTQAESTDSPSTQALAFEHLLERLSGKDLGWFFKDWILRDRGLPDLSITNVATTQTPAGPGHSTGWLVAVTVRNEGGATAEVPLTVRSGQFSVTQRMKIPGFGQATERVLVEAPPTELLLNDGSTPELRASTHTREINVRTEK